MTEPRHTTERSLDTLRISEREALALLAQMDQQTESVDQAERRGGDRRTYRQVVEMVAQIVHPGGGTQNYLVRARNLSATGLGFLHGSFLHNHTGVILLMRTLAGQTVRVPGKVVRCRFLSGKVHEIGVRFAKPIDPQAFVPDSAPPADLAR